MSNHPKRVPLDSGSCGKEPDECESPTSGSESGVEEGIPLPAVTVSPPVSVTAVLHSSKALV